MFTTTLGALTVYQFICQFIDTNSFVICSHDSALIVDPVDSKEFYQFVKSQRLQNALVILTHSHYDHISGLNMVRKLLPETHVIASKLCSINIQNPKTNLSNIASAIIAFHNQTEVDVNLVAPFSCEPADEVFEKELRIKWEGHKLQFAEYKGHSKDSVCCILDNTYLFSGDTILPIPTVTRLPGGSTAKFWGEDMPKLEKLIEQIRIVFPGHGMAGTLKEMIEVNKRPEILRIQK